MGAKADWELCKGDFTPDGSLRDIYVLNTSLKDWQTVVDAILRGPFGARVIAEEQRFAIEDLASLFRAGNRPGLLFRVGHFEMRCLFFLESQIEFSFDPRGMTEASLNEVLGFVAMLGRVTGKSVVLTPENAPHIPIFRYVPGSDEVTYLPARPQGGTHGP